MAITMRDRTVGNSVLAVFFGIATIGAASRAWQLIASKGIDAQGVIWLLAVVGFVSLTWRSLHAARTARTTQAPPA